MIKINSQLTCERSFRRVWKLGGAVRHASWAELTRQLHTDKIGTYHEHGKMSAHESGRECFTAKKHVQTKVIEHLPLRSCFKRFVMRKFEFGFSSPRILQTCCCGIVRWTIWPLRALLLLLSGRWLWAAVLRLRRLLIQLGSRLSFYHNGGNR